MHAMSRVAVIIVNYNAGEMLHQCLAALQVQSVRPARVLVMDNGSQDGSLDRCQSSFAWAEFHRLNANLGFARANNIAVELVPDCEWLALLNPDAFPDRQWLETFTENSVKYPEVDTFASCMTRADGSDIIDGAGDCYRVDGVAWPRYQGALVSRLPPDIEDVFAPCAGAGFYRRSAFLEVGGFSERYFCYHEDVDLGFRLQLRGSRCRFLRDAIVRHVGSAIAGKGSDFSVYHVQRNMVWTYFRNMPSPYFWMYLPAHLLVNIGSIIWFGFFCHRWIVWQAKKDAIKALRGVWSERQHIQLGRLASKDRVMQHLERGTILSSVVPKIIRRLRGKSTVSHRHA
jgi:GT2 family glycosyltransferase